MNSKPEDPHAEVAQALGSAFAARLRPLGSTIADVLEAAGVRRLYGVGGDYAAALLGALDLRFDVRPGANELHAAYAACAQAELGGLGVCVTTYTVGSLPALAAAALALTEGLPVVFLSGAPGEAEVGTPSWLHHMVAPAHAWAVDPSAALRAYRAMGLRAERLQGKRGTGQPSIAGEQFRDLVDHALSHCEPVFVEVPRDLIAQLVQPLSPRRPSTFTDVDAEGAGAIAEHIVQELRNARHPVLLVGERMRRSKALRTLTRTLIDRLQLPYATNAFAKGVLDERDPLCVGVYNGIFGNRRARAYVEDRADYVFELCTSVVAQDTATAFGTGTYRPASKARHTVLRGSAADGSDVERVLEHILATMTSEPVGYRPSQPPERVPVSPDEPLGFHVLASALDECQDACEDAFVYLPEIGNSYFASFGLHTRASSLGRSWLTNPWYAAMGNAIPYAREVALSLRDRGATDVPIVMIGDGGFHFQSSELARIQADGLFAIVLLVRNNIFHLGKIGDGAIYKSSSEHFDASALAKAYGGSYRLASRASDLRNAFKDATRDRQRWHLIEVPVPTTNETQSEEIRLLNLYIQARGGNAQAQANWEQLVEGPKRNASSRTS